MSNSPRIVKTRPEFLKSDCWKSLLSLCELNIPPMLTDVYISLQLKPHILQCHGQEKAWFEALHLLSCSLSQATCSFSSFCVSGVCPSRLSSQRFILEFHQRCQRWRWDITFRNIFLFCCKFVYYFTLSLKKIIILKNRFLGRGIPLWRARKQKIIGLSSVTNILVSSNFHIDLKDIYWSVGFHTACGWGWLNDVSELLVGSIFTGPVKEL